MQSVRELEYAALRATIRERGSLRVLLAWATMAVWATLIAFSPAWEGFPAATLLSLLVLAAGFEAVYALHSGVERVGRYLQVFHEQQAAGEVRLLGWEATAMTYGQRFGSGGVDPLFSVVFLIAVSLNYGPVLTGGVLVERVGLGACHALLAVRVLIARRRAARQRQDDLERFRSLL